MHGIPARNVPADNSHAAQRGLIVELRSDVAAVNRLTHRAVDFLVQPARSSRRCTSPGANLTGPVAVLDHAAFSGDVDRFRAGHGAELTYDVANVLLGRCRRNVKTFTDFTVRMAHSH